MRSALTAFVLVILAGCASTRAVTPREYLDEETAATVTVVAEPWIYSEKRASSSAWSADHRPTTAALGELASEERDFLSVYAIDVNRMGTHRQYLAVLQSLPPGGTSGAEPSKPILELQIADQPMALQPITETPRQHGIAQPPAQADMRGSRWWYFPVDKQVLTALAKTRDLQTTLVVDGNRIAYDSWRDGSAEVAELTTVLP